MADRSFRVIIRNQTQNLVLSQSFNHLCQGNWTAGQAPPGVIGFAHPGGRNTIFGLPNLEGTGVLQSVLVPRTRHFADWWPFLLGVASVGCVELP